MNKQPKPTYGYVVCLKGTHMCETYNGSFLGTLGDQTPFLQSDSVRLYATTPTRAKYSKAKYDIWQARRCNKCVELFNHSYKEPVTLNENIQSES